MGLFSRTTSPFKLRITIKSGRNLAAGDENGLSDPYAVLYIDNTKYKTKVHEKTLNPIWRSTFETTLPVHKRIRSIEIYVWDKDKISDNKIRELFKRDDFLGKISIPVPQLFTLIHASGDALHYDSPANDYVSLTLKKRTEEDNVSGEIQIKFGLVTTPIEEDADMVRFWNEYIN